MFQLRDDLGFGFAAAGAGIYPFAFGFFRGFHGDSAFIPGMAQRLRVVGNIAVAAFGAGIGGIALLYAVRRRYLRCVAMGHNGGFPGFGIIAVLAVPAIQAGFGTGCRDFNRPGTHAVAGRVHIIVHIGIIAADAGVGGVAPLQTGGCRHSCLISMAQGSNIAVGVAVAAVAGVGGIAPLRTGGGRYGIGVAVAGGRQNLGLTAVAAAAVPVGAAGLGTGGFPVGDPLTVIMAQGSYIGIRIAVTAAAAGMGSVAPFGTGGGSDCGYIVVAQRIHCSGFIVLAADAVMALRAGGGAGSFLHRVPAAIFMAQGRGIGILVAVAAAGTGMGGVALCGTGGLRHNSHIVMAQCLQGSGFGIAAVPAVMLFCTGGQTAGLLGCVPLTEVMGQHVHIGIRHSVAAAGAGMGGVALCGTGGRRYLGGIHMAQVFPGGGRAPGQAVVRRIGVGSGVFIAEYGSLSIQGIGRIGTVGAVNPHFFQSVAGIKGLLPKGRNALRDDNARQGIAVTEGIITDGHHAFRDDNLLQHPAGEEGHGTQSRHTLRNIGILQLPAV